jgi:hypothetical protein
LLGDRDTQRHFQQSQQAWEKSGQAMRQRKQNNQ